MEGSLPPDLEGTLFRVGPAAASDTSLRTRWREPEAEFEDQRGPGSEHAEATGSQPRSADAGAPGASATPDTPGAPEARGALHAVELRDGKAVSYLRRESDADAGVFWHAGSVLALPECGIPSRYSRLLEPEEFAGALTVPIASHVHKVATDGSRVLFSVDDTAHGGKDEPDGIFLRLGEWDASGVLRTAQSIPLERATWQHDVGVTARHVVFLESPTRRLTAGPGSAATVPFGWVPGAEGWLGLARRGGDGTGVRWVRLDPCLVTHVLGAWDEGAEQATDNQSSVVVYVCRYEAPEQGRPIDPSAPVVGPAGVGLSPIGDGLAVLERWRVVGGSVERTQLDERHVEYPRMDPQCEGSTFRYGYAVEMAWPESSGAGSPVDRTHSTPARTDALPVGVLKFDVRRDLASSWRPGPGRAPTEAVFARAADGGGDDEGWLLVVVDDENRGASDLYVLDASQVGERRQRPEAVVHLPNRLPLRSHGEWVPADRYR